MKNITYKGIDVSAHNGKIDFAKVKNAGIDFVIIRGGYGNSTVDKTFEANINGALSVGLRVGVYWFGYAYTVTQAIKEGEFVSKLLEKYKGKIAFPIFYDWENASYDYAVKNGVKPDKSLVSSMVKAFCDTISEHGWFAGVYSNIDYLNRFLDNDVKQMYDLWVAQWSSACSYAGSYSMWQYGAETNKIDSKYVDGINGVVDKDYCYVDYPEIIVSLGANGFAVKEPDKIVGDFDNDGKVTAHDALVLLQHVVGINNGENYTDIGGKVK